MMDEDDGRRENEDSEEENWTDAWDDISGNLKPALVTCAAGSTNQKLPPGGTLSTKEKHNAVNQTTSVSELSESTSESASRTSFLRMGLNDNKAGMEGLDKEHINRIIMEASKGSKFYENQLKKEAVMQRRITEQQKRLDQLSDRQIEEGKEEADQLLAELEAGRDFTRTIVHVDMDAFYAAVEMRDNPMLRTKPMAVGGMSMLSTSNYLARRYGVRAAMPGFIAKKLCPSLTIVPCNFDKYIAVSKDIREVMSEYDPNLCPMSLDEAYLDLTDHLEKRKVMSEEDRTFSKRVDASLLCCCTLIGDKAESSVSPILKMQDIKYCTKTTSVRDMKENEYETVGVGIKPSSLDEETSKTENTSNADTSQVSSSCSEDKGQNCDQETETVTNQNRNLDSANGIEKDIETGTNQNNNLDSANGTDTSKNLKNDSVSSLSHLCAHCGKPRDPLLLAEKVTFGTSPEEAVNEMRFRIEVATQLTASAGIAPNTMLAKVCSDKNKPNGQYIIPSSREAVMAFINELPLKKVCGIGKVSEQMLSALGIMSCHDLYVKRGILLHLYSTTSFHHFMQICAGIGSTRVERDGERKSISVERTFPALCRPAELYKKCYELSEKLAEDLKEESIMGKTVTLKLKTVKFETVTRGQSLLNPTSDLEQIYSTARDLLRAEMQNSAPEPLHLRLMGVRMSNLSKSQQTAPKQGTIVGCFRKIETRGLERYTAGELGKLVRQDVSGTATQGGVKHVPLYGDLNYGDGSQTTGHRCHDGVDAMNQEMFSNVKQGKNASESFGDIDKMTTNEDLLDNVTSEGSTVCDPCLTPSEDTQKVFDEISAQQRKFFEDAQLNSQRDGLADVTCDGVVPSGPDHVSTARQDVSVASRTNYSKHVANRPGISQQCSPAENPTADMFTCPVCNIPQRGCDLAGFNSHVDSCLSKRAVRELLEADKRGQHSVSCSKRSTEEDNEKRSVKKRRTALTPGLGKHHNIQSFFKEPPC